MHVEMVKLANIKPAEYNPRTLSPEERAGLQASIEQFGQVENLIINKDGTLISGHQRYTVMLEDLEWDEAACLILDVDKTTEKKLNVTMNNQAIGGSWDMIKLGAILEELRTEEDYQALRLNKLEPLDVGGVNYETLEQGKAPTNDAPQTTGGGVKSYTLVFDSEEEQEEFMQWVMSLRAIYPDADTITQRVLFAIKQL